MWQNIQIRAFFRVKHTKKRKTEKAEKKKKKAGLPFSRQSCKKNYLLVQSYDRTRKVLERDYCSKRELGLNFTTFLAGSIIFSPVLGFTP